MNKRLIIGIILGVAICVCLCALIVLIIWFVYTQNYNKTSTQLQLPTVSIVEPTIEAGKTITATGMVFTTGAGDPDIGAPKVADYQLTYLVPDKNPLPNVDGYFIGGQNSEYIAKYFLAKCVSISGTLPEHAADQATIYQNFNRVFVEVSKVTLEPIDSCKAGIPSIPSSEAIAGEPTSFSGTVVLANLAQPRPAPDISYDFTLKLATPYLDKNNASGEDQSVNEIAILPSNFQTMQGLSGARDTKVTIQGYFAWGLAESKIFYVEKVTKL